MLEIRNKKQSHLAEEPLQFREAQSAQIVRAIFEAGGFAGLLGRPCRRREEAKMRLIADGLCSLLA